jgi:hypothetical protein
LRAVEQFIACETKYASSWIAVGMHHHFQKKDWHRYENKIEKLGEPDNRMRPLSPDWSCHVGKEDKMRSLPGLWYA